MSNQRLEHDTAADLATDLVTVFQNVLRDEEKRDAWQECYQAARAALSKFCLLSEQEWRRLHPLHSRK